MKADIRVKSREYAAESELSKAIADAFKAGAEWMQNEKVGP